MSRPTALTPSLSKFCEKVRVMNQTQNKSLVLTASEARNIESDIMELLMLLTDLQSERIKRNETIEIQVESPGFK